MPHYSISRAHAVRLCCIDACAAHVPSCCLHLAPGAHDQGGGLQAAFVMASRENKCHWLRSTNRIIEVPGECIHIMKSLVAKDVIIGQSEFGGLKMVREC